MNYIYTSLIRAYYNWVQLEKETGEQWVIKALRGGFWALVRKEDEKNG